MFPIFLKQKSWSWENVSFFFKNRKSWYCEFFYFLNRKIMTLRKCFLFLKIWSPQSIFLYRIVFGNNFYWFPGKMIGKYVLFFHLWKTCYNSNWSAPPLACSRLGKPPTCSCELSIYSFFNYAYFFLKKEQARSKLK